MTFTVKTFNLSTQVSFVLTILDIYILRGKRDGANNTITVKLDSI